MSIVNRIRPLLGFTHVLDAALLLRINAILAGMVGNPAYLNPPVDLAALKAAIDAYTAAIADALDGGKKAIAEREKNREDVLAMVRTLAHYVEDHCNGELATFLSSGFQAASTIRTAQQPLPQPNIIRVDQGNTGQLLVNIKPLPNARHYELRYAPLAAGGTPDAWTTILVANARPAVVVNSLTPTMTYVFQVRAFSKLGHTDWSDPVNRICI